MFICPNCKKISEVPLNFCTSCGSRMEEAKSNYSAPSSESAPNTYNETNPYIYENAPAPTPAPSKAKAIVGMALSIAGFANAAVSLLYIFSFMAEGLGDAALAFAIIMFLITMPLSLVGLILSSKCRSAGDRSVFTKLGKIFGIVGIVFSVLVLLFGIIGMLGADSFSYSTDGYEYDFDYDHDYYF